MSSFRLSVSAHAVVPNRYDCFAQVGGQPWTDILGRNTRTVREFRIRGGNAVEFYFPITNVVVFDGLPQRCFQAAVLFNLNSWGRLERFVLYDGWFRVAQSDFSSLNVSGDFLNTWQLGSNWFEFADHEIFHGLMIMTTFRAYASNYDATVRFGGATLITHDGVVEPGPPDLRLQPLNAEPPPDLERQPPEQQSAEQ